MKPMIIGYVPTPDVINARDFMKHIASHRPEHQMVLASKHSWPDADVFQLNTGPELVNQLGAVAMENILFLTAARIANHHNATHFLYIDFTCRFNSWMATKAWDRLIFDEFFKRKPYAAVGGSMVINNMTDGDMRWMTQCSGAARDGLFPPVQFIEGHLKPAVFVNGPLAVYSCHWIREIFGDVTHSINICHAIHPHPYSYWIGKTLREKMGDQVFQSVLHMQSLFSTVNNVNCEGDWRNALIHGDEKVCAVNGIY